LGVESDDNVQRTDAELEEFFAEEYQKLQWAPAVAPVSIS
jgi:hypothetical protein